MLIKGNNRTYLTKRNSKINLHPEHMNYLVYKKKEKLTLKLHSSFNKNIKNKIITNKFDYLIESH